MASETTLPALTAQPRTVMCAGKAVTVRPLTVDDLGAWDQWAREDFLRATTNLAANVKDWRDRTEQRDRALEQAAQISFGSHKALGAMTSVGGKLRAAWLAIRDDKQTPGQVWELMGTGPEAYRNLNKVYGALMVASGFAEDANAEADPQTLAMAAINLIMGSR